MNKTLKNLRNAAVGLGMLVGASQVADAQTRVIDWVPSHVRVQGTNAGPGCPETPEPAKSWGEVSYSARWPNANEDTNPCALESEGYAIKTVACTETDGAQPDPFWRSPMCMTALIENFPIDNNGGSMPFTVTDQLTRLARVEPPRSFLTPQHTDVHYADVLVSANPQARNNGIASIDGKVNNISTPKNDKDAYLNRGRFQVHVDFEKANGETGSCTTLPISQDSANFWCYDPKIVEFNFKVVDACNFNDRFWLYGAGSTDQGYTVTVVDHALPVDHPNRTKTYSSNVGERFPAITDSDAFASCDAVPVAPLPNHAVTSFTIPEPSVFGLPKVATDNPYNAPDKETRLDLDFLVSAVLQARAGSHANVTVEAFDCDKAEYAALAKCNDGTQFSDRSYLVEVFDVRTAKRQYRPGSEPSEMCQQGLGVEKLSLTGVVDMGQGDAIPAYRIDELSPVATWEGDYVQEAFFLLGGMSNTTGDFDWNLVGGKKIENKPNTGGSQWYSKSELVPIAECRDATTHGKVCFPTGYFNDL